TAAGPPLHLLFVGAEGALGVVLEAVLRVRRRPEATVGRGWRLRDVSAGLDVLREAMQGDLRPLVLRLYDAADSAFQGLDGGCLLVGATAGPRAVAEAEAAVLAELAAAAGAEPLGEAPWERWLAHRFDLSADRLRDFLRPPGAFLDTIELASTWTSLPALYEEVRDHLAAAGMALCHFSHAYAQGCCAYFTFAGSASDEAAAEAAYLAAWRGAMEIALRHGATISLHHGVVAVGDVAVVRVGRHRQQGQQRAVLVPDVEAVEAVEQRELVVGGQQHVLPALLAGDRAARLGRLDHQHHRAPPRPVGPG